MAVTFDRDAAVTYEDVDYLTPDHPLVLSAISALLDGASGCASALRWQGAPKAGLLVQCLYVLEAIGPVPLELYRYMPPRTVLITVDINGHPYDAEIADVRKMKEMSGDLLNMLLSKLSSRLDRLVESAARQAHEKLNEYGAQTVVQAERQLQEEYVRLQELRKVNDMVSEAEAEQAAAKKEAVLQALRQAKPRLDGLRVILMET